MAANDIQLTSTRIDSVLLPSNFSRPYQMYVLQQGANLEKLATKANSAGQDANAAQQQNDEQDKQIAEQGKKIESLTGDYISKSATGPQSMASALGALSFSVQGVKVVGARVVGFTAATGTALKGAFDANKDFSAESAPAGLKEARQRIKALEDALRSHGLIN